MVMDNLTITPQAVPAPPIGYGLPVVLAVGGVLFSTTVFRAHKEAAFARGRDPIRRSINTIFLGGSLGIARGYSNLVLSRSNVGGSAHEPSRRAL